MALSTEDPMTAVTGTVTVDGLDASEVIWMVPRCVPGHGSRDVTIPTLIAPSPVPPAGERVIHGTDAVAVQ